ncbi:MAG: (Fe-S)-binding protein [Anaerolineales bacterium]|nr:(Fe-S)-binding protein [Anaerolineales bacterium]
MPTVQLFITCLVDSFYPQTGEAIVSILRRLGLTVNFPHDQTCCGQPPFNAGLRAEARPLAEHTLRVFEATEGDIIIPSGSCAHMIKHGYQELFRDNPVWLPRAQAVGKRVYEFTEYLVDRLGVTDLGARWDGILTYHSSCHTLRGMHIDRQPRLLLANVRGAQIVELPQVEECCGFGGIFSMEHPELSAEWLKRKISNLEATRSPTLVVTEAGCLMHITGGLHRQRKKQRVIHIAEVLNHK